MFSFLAISQYIRRTLSRQMGRPRSPKRARSGRPRASRSRRERTRTKGSMRVTSSEPSPRSASGGRWSTQSQVSARANSGAQTPSGCSYEAKRTGELPGAVVCRERRRRPVAQARERVAGVATAHAIIGELSPNEIAELSKPPRAAFCIVLSGVELYSGRNGSSS